MPVPVPMHARFCEMLPRFTSSAISHMMCRVTSSEVWTSTGENAQQNDMTAEIKLGPLKLLDYQMQIQGTVGRYTRAQVLFANGGRGTQKKLVVESVHIT